MKSNGKRGESSKRSVLPADGAACYFCGEAAGLEKGGRTVCASCKYRVNGTEYPLRRPTVRPLYNQGEAARLRNQLTGE